MKNQSDLISKQAISWLRTNTLDVLVRIDTSNGSIYTPCKDIDNPLLSGVLPMGGMRIPYKWKEVYI